MTRSREKFFSVAEEIAVHPELSHEAAELEEMPEPQVSSADAYYTSVAYEPGVGRGGARAAGSSCRCSLPRAVLTTMLCGVTGGLVAIPALFLKGRESGVWLWMMVVFGPFAEETLKQGGMIFQLEKLPATVCRGWQLWLGGALAGAVFGVLENLLYGHVYLRHLPPEQLAAAMSYRWIACTALHIGCTMISVLGLRRVWRDARQRGIPCQISDAFPWFVAAVVLHGGYNLAMLLLQPWLFPGVK